MKAPVHVAVVGGSGSGKTWLAEKLAAALAPRAARLSLDDFYRDLSALPPAERDAVNFDDPAAIDWKKFQSVIGIMRVGEKIDLPVYDFATHTRRASPRNFLPPPLVVWDGLWLLHHDWLRKQFTLTIFLSSAVRTSVFGGVRNAMCASAGAVLSQCAVNFSSTSNRCTNDLSNRSVGRQRKALIRQ
jgi:uridine kinase